MKNYSKQREEIIRVVKEMYNHPTAEEIYIVVKNENPDVSRSTVYRNLGLLVENNLLYKISMMVGPDRYDYIRQDHNHAVCTKCGKIYDFNYNFEFEDLKKSVFEQTKIELSPYGVVVNGICEECKKNN